MSNTSRKQLYLFSQLPVDCVFAFESPDNPKHFQKISDSYARADDGVHPVGRNTLVFPVYPFCLVSERDEALVSVLPTYWEETVPPYQGADLGDYIEEELW